VIYRIEGLSGLGFEGAVVQNGERQPRYLSGAKGAKDLIRKVLLNAVLSTPSKTVILS